MYVTKKASNVLFSIFPGLSVLACLPNERVYVHIMYVHETALCRGFSTLVHFIAIMLSKNHFVMVDVHQSYDACTSQK